MVETISTSDSRGRLIHHCHLSYAIQASEQSGTGTVANQFKLCDLLLFNADIEVRRKARLEMVVT